MANMIATALSKKTTHVVITHNGKQYNLGRVDNKLWAPRLWFYKFIIYPYLKRKQEK